MTTEYLTDYFTLSDLDLIKEAFDELWLKRQDDYRVIKAREQIKRAISYKESKGCKRKDFVKDELILDLTEKEDNHLVAKCELLKTVKSDFATLKPILEWLKNTEETICWEDAYKVDWKDGKDFEFIRPLLNFCDNLIHLCRFDLDKYEYYNDKIDEWYFLKHDGKDLYFFPKETFFLKVGNYNLTYSEINGQGTDSLISIYREKDSLEEYGIEESKVHWLDCSKLKVVG